MRGIGEHFRRYAHALRCREGGFGGMLPREKIHMVKFVAFWCIFGSDFVCKKFQNLPFFI